MNLVTILWVLGAAMFWGAVCLWVAERVFLVVWWRRYKLAMIGVNAWLPRMEGYRKLIVAQNQGRMAEHAAAIDSEMRLPEFLMKYGVRRDLRTIADSRREDRIPREVGSSG